MSEEFPRLPGKGGLVDVRRFRYGKNQVALNPSSSFVRLISGSVQLRNGEPDIAAEQLEMAIRLDPISSMNAFARIWFPRPRYKALLLDGIARAEAAAPA